MKQQLVSLHVVDGHSVIVVQVSTSNISSTWAERNSRDASGSSWAFKLADLLSSINVPDMDSWFASDLASDNSLAVSTDVKRQDVISVEWELLSLMLALVSNLLASVESLLKSSGVHHDSKGGNHEDSAAVMSVAQVLLAVRGTISINVLDLPLALRLLLVQLYKCKVSYSRDNTY